MVNIIMSIKVEMKIELKFRVLLFGNSKNILLDFIGKCM